MSEKTEYRKRAKDEGKVYFEYVLNARHLDGGMDGIACQSSVGVISLKKAEKLRRLFDEIDRETEGE